MGITRKRTEEKRVNRHGEKQERRCIQNQKDNEGELKIRSKAGLAANIPVFMSENI